MGGSVMSHIKLYAISLAVLLVGSRLIAVSAHVAAEGVLTSYLSDRVTGLVESYTGKQEKNLIKSTTDILIKAMLDPLLSDKMLDILPKSDPRRYVIMGLFQLGKNVPKAYSLISEKLPDILSSLNGLWVKKKTESEYVKNETDDLTPYNIHEWLQPRREENQCPARDFYQEKDRSWWDRLTEKREELQDMAISCFFATALSKIAVATVLGGGNPVVGSVIGALGDYLIRNYLVPAVKDIFIVETSEHYKDTHGESLVHVEAIA